MKLFNVQVSKQDTEQNKRKTTMSIDIDSRHARTILSACMVSSALLLSACDSNSGSNEQQVLASESPLTSGNAIDADNDESNNGTSNNTNTSSTDTGNSDEQTTSSDAGSANDDTQNNTAADDTQTNPANPANDDTQDNATDSTNTPDNEDPGNTNLPVNSGSDTLPPTAPLVLQPLPQPPLTGAPSAADEPVAVNGPLSTVTEYFLVRNPDGQLPKDTSGSLTEADFNAGLLPAVVTTPAHVDPTVNRAPFFEGLDNQTVFAGSTLELILKPIDPDGSIPGMFPENLPEGAQYIDNFNGTRTLRWRPLQPDVGIREFTITAVDPVEPQYRTRQTVRIQTILPADTSGIVNLAPGVNAVRLHTVAVNDPVVIELKGTDPNGTIPTLEVLNQPPGATLVPHPTEPDFSVLRFIPTTTGLITMTVVARDSVNPDSTGRTTVEVDVRAESDFIRDGSSLRSLATARDFRLGYASLKDFYYRPDGALYARTAAEEFNFVTSENSLKWSFINPLPGRYRWASADNLVTFARVKGMEVHGHTLVWHRQLPDWIKTSAPETRETHMREFIDRVLNRYSDRVAVWDVVNESFEDDGSFRNSVWFEAMGERYIETAFRQARESAPNARLLYNEYDVAWNGPKSDAMFRMLQSLKDRGTPLTGVGFQMHIFATFDKFDEVEANFQKAADLDLDVYITELDVSIKDGATTEQQAEVYRRVLDICLRQPRCKGMQTWGFTDQYSWRRDYNPLLLDRAYQAKPAYKALQERLSEN